MISDIKKFIKILMSSRNTVSEKCKYVCVLGLCVGVWEWMGVCVCVCVCVRARACFF